MIKQLARAVKAFRSVAASRQYALALSIAAVAGLIGPATAQEPVSGIPSYDVELVLFRPLSSNATPEQWNMEAEQAKERMAVPDEEPSPFGTAPAPSSSAPAVTRFPALPASKFKLTAIEEALRRSRDFQLLAHIGWTQPGFGREATRFVSLDSMAPESSGLAGQIALWRGRYLHLTLDLVYESPADSAAAGQRFVLRQTRRMRSNERHYIDHPQFGAIVVVTPSS